LALRTSFTNLASTSLMLACLSSLAWKSVLAFESSDILPNLRHSSDYETLVSNSILLAILLWCDRMAICVRGQYLVDEGGLDELHHYVFGVGGESLA
jgi:hypothetical protein